MIASKESSLNRRYSTGAPIKFLPEVGEPNSLQVVVLRLWQPGFHQVQKLCNSFLENNECFVPVPQPASKMVVHLSKRPLSN